MPCKTKKQGWYKESKEHREARLLGLDRKRKAKNKEEAKKQLHLPKFIRIKKIVEIN
jgi:hypothetical protein